MTHRSRDRAQSEVVGEVLLVGIVVVAVSAIGATIVLQSATPEERTLADVEVTAVENATRVAVVHQGGDAIAGAQLRVRVSVDGSERTTSLNATASTGDADGQFEPGDRWVVDLAGPDLTADSAVRVRVVDDATGSVVADATVEPT